LETASNLVSTGNIIARATKFKNRGFKVGTSVIRNLVERIEEIEREPRNSRGRYVKYNNDGYWPEFKVKEKELYGDFFNLVDEDTLILPLMSDCDKLMQMSKNIFNGVEKKEAVKRKKFKFYNPITWFGK
jgi:hypothetical protein